MDKIDFIKNKVEHFEKATFEYKKIKIALVDEILGLIESVSERDFELNIIYAKIILWKDDEYSLDDAYWILNNLEDGGKNNFEWNYLMARINFEMNIYKDAKKYIDKIIETDNYEVKELSKKIQNMNNYENRK